MAKDRGSHSTTRLNEILGIVAAVLAILAFFGYREFRDFMSSAETAEPSPAAGISTVRTMPASPQASTISPTDVRILFDETHNEYWGSRIDEQLAPLAADLRERGYQVSALRDGQITSEFLSNHDILVIPEPFDPPKPFTDQEIEAIREFVQRGGGLLLISVGWSWVDYTERPINENPANQLARALGAGITVNDDLLADPTHHIGHETQPLFHEFDEEHPILQDRDIDTIATPGNASSLRLSGPAKALVWGDEDTYSAEYSERTFEPGSRPAVAAVSRYGQGRIVFLGHVGFLTVDASTGRGLNDYDNRNLALGIFEWLARIR